MTTGKNIPTRMPKPGDYIKLKTWKSFYKVKHYDKEQEYITLECWPNPRFNDHTFWFDPNDLAWVFREE